MGLPMCFTFVATTRKHPGRDPRMRLLGRLRENDNGKSDVGSRCLVPLIPMLDQAPEVWQDVTKAYSNSYLVWMTYVDLPMSALSSPNSLSESRLASRAAK
jgi:hypothetical protein